MGYWCPPSNFTLESTLVVRYVHSAIFLFLLQPFLFLLGRRLVCQYCFFLFVFITH